MPESRAAVGRLQRQMLALLAKYCDVDSRQHQHKLQVAAAAELACSNPIAASTCGTESVELDDIVAQMEISIYEVLANVTSLCTSLVSRSGIAAFTASCLVIFCSGLQCVAYFRC